MTDPIPGGNGPARFSIARRCRRPPGARWFQDRPRRRIWPAETPQAGTRLPWGRGGRSNCRWGHPAGPGPRIPM